MRALFFGTPDIAVSSLEALASIADVACVICQPDRPAGRGMNLRAPAVKTAAVKLGLPIAQPTKIRNAAFADWVNEQRVDVALVIAYGRILPQAVLDSPRRGCMNLHASLLPKYRGAAPVNWAIARGETSSGVCLMQMDASMDTGAILSSKTVPIGADDTAGYLAERLATVAAEIVLDDLRAAVDGELHAVPQDEAFATYAPKLSKEDGRIDWRRSASEVHAHVRGMTPWPGALTENGAKPLKVLSTRIHSCRAMCRPGEVIVADSSCVLVGCGDGVVELVELQAPGKKAMLAGNMVVGRTIRIGDILGYCV